MGTREPTATEGAQVGIAARVVGTVAEAVRRLEPWLATTRLGADDSRHVDGERDAANLVRARLALPLLAVLHWAFAAVLHWGHAGAGGSFVNASWQREVTAANALMGLLDWTLAGLAWFGSEARGPTRGRLLCRGTAVLYLAFAAWVTGIDQRLTPSVTAYMIAVFGVALLVRLPARVAAVVYAHGLVALVAAVWVYQLTPAMRVSALLNGIVVGVLGWMLAWVLERSFVQETLAKRTIAAQQRELEAANADLTRSLALLQRTNLELEREVGVRLQAELELQRLATRDPLTGAANRRYFLACAEEASARWLGRAGGLCLAMLDVDTFKQINDSHGHAAGDAVLVHVVQRCQGLIRADDAVGRLGGDEFAVLFPGSTDEEALAIAERLRCAVGGDPIPTPVGPLPVTVSIGLTAVADERDAVDRALLRADGALYEAKRSGRNRTVSRTPHPTAARPHAVR